MIVANNLEECYKLMQEAKDTFNLLDLVLTEMAGRGEADSGYIDRVLAGVKVQRKQANDKITAAKTYLDLHSN